MIYETLQWRRCGGALAAGLQCIVCPLFLHTGIATATTMQLHRLLTRIAYQVHTTWQAVQAQFRWPNFKDPIPLCLDDNDQHFFLKCRNMQFLQKCDSLLGTVVLPGF